MNGSAQTRYVILSILLIFATVNITKTTLDILQSSKRLNELQGEVSELEDKKTSLTNTIDYKNSDAYVEEKARNELNLIKPGEKVYVVLGNVAASSINSNILGESSDSGGIKDTNLYHWYRLFL